VKLELEIYSHLCSTKHFKINDVWACSYEFGLQSDNGKEDDIQTEGGCSGMEFVPNKFPDASILKKFNITKSEYFEVCEQLKEKLSFGYCGWCV
jgi:hypothetical protein